MKAYQELCAAYYDLSKPPHDGYDDVRYYRRELSGGTGPVLVAGSGNGRLLLPLLSAGIAAEGLDTSEHMIERCRTNAARLGLAPTVHRDSLQQFRAPGRYRAIIVPNGTFQLLTELADAREALRRFRENLAPDGLLHLPLFLPTQELRGPANVWLAREPVTDADGSTITLECQRSADLFEQLVHQWNRYQRWQEGRLVSAELERFDLRWYGARELPLVLEREGLEVVDLAGDYVHKPCGAGHEMLCYVARRR
jgi:hypothetical protein